MEQLPAEIYTEIFRLARIEGPIDFYHPRQTPGPQSQICQKWRTIAQSSPVLWSTLVMHEKNIVKNNVFRYLAAFKSHAATFLEYSKDHPLEIRLWTMDEDEYGSEEAIAVTRTFMEMMWPHRRRWAEFTTDHEEWPSYWTLDNNIGLEPADAFPVLRRLNLPFLVNDGPGKRVFMSMFSCLPSLSSLCLGALPYEDTAAIENISWPNLCQLSLHIHTGRCDALIPLLNHLPMRHDPSTWSVR